MAVFSTLRRAGAAFAALALLAASEANPFFNSDLPEDSTIEKRQGGTFAIVGANNSPNTQTRLEIRTLEQNADQWNLFLLAMQDFKGMDQSPIDSYYQIAEIHGVPNVPWDGVQGNPSQGDGYCTHVSSLFPAWHRTYMALFEQAFVNHVTTIVNQFQGADQQRYAAAASTIRFPYWDWAAVPPSGQPVLPSSITDLMVTLNTPTGSQTVLNPLFRYDFHPLDHAGMLWDPWDNWNVTLRYPTDTTPQSTDNNGDATAALNNDNPSLRQRVYNLMTQCNDYAGFSQGDASQRPPQCTEALEDIHNNIHNDVGGPQQGHQGHMAIIPVASYDPAFWLHHANVDRLFAIWQGLYPNSYDVQGTTGAPTYAIPQGTQVTPNTFLAPFHADSNGGPHTSATVRDTHTFKYDYPETGSGDTSPAGMMAKVNALYGSGATAPSSESQRTPNTQNANANQGARGNQGNQRAPQFGQGSQFGQGKQEVRPGDAGRAGLPGKHFARSPYEPVYHAKKEAHGEVSSVVGEVKSVALKYLSAGSPTSPGVPLSTGHMPNPSNSTAKSGSLWDLPDNLADQMSPTKRAPIDYSCKITIQPYNQGGSSVRVFIFLGNPASENPLSWSSDSNLVGWTGTFSSPAMRMNTLTAATIPLTTALLSQQASGVITGIGLNQTLPVLQKKLTWRVAGPNGAIPNDQVPGLTVGVQSTPVKPAASDNEFPSFGQWTTHQEVTSGKPGGIQSGMSGNWHNDCVPQQQ